MKTLPLALLLLVAIAPAAHAQDVVGQPIAPWQPGMLDIHQISTSRGNAGLYILPDGTTLLVDTGELPGSSPKRPPARPDDSRGAGEWVVRYIRHALGQPAQSGLDYVLVTHFHQDHMGEIAAEMPTSPRGYVLTGITRVLDELKVGMLLDRAWPDYAAVPQPDAPFMKNYIACVKWNVAHNGLKVERFAPGRNDQVVLRREREKYPRFEFRNVAANAEIWTGTGAATASAMPSLATLPRKQWPDENVLSSAFLLRYGAFDYFNGGDIPGIRPKSPPWYDIETPVARAVGPVDAAILNHHGYKDSMNEFFVGRLRARVWTISVWDAHHPTPDAWERLHSEAAYPGPRDVFATDVHPDARTAIKDVDRMASQQGHIVLRVSPGGDEYRVTIVDDRSEGHTVTKVAGPYRAR